MSKIKKPPHPFPAEQEGMRTTTITLKHPTHAKLKAIADRERRSLSGQAEVFIEAGILTHQQP